MVKEIKNLLIKHQKVKLNKNIYKKVLLKLELIYFHFKNYV